jgi:cobalt-zinc-cadmium efflux system membrane fusion protein
VAEKHPRRGLRGVAAAGVAAAALGGAGWWWSSSADARPVAAVVAPSVPHVEQGAIVLPASFRDRLGLETQPARQAPLTPLVRATGTVTFNPTVSAAISTRIRGNVRRILKVEGDRVAAGEVVAEVESAELGGAQAEVTVAEANLKASQANLTREQALLQKNLTTGREVEVALADVERDRALLTAAEQKVRALGGGLEGPFGIYLIRAPLAGTVVERHLAQGQALDGTEVLMQTTDLTRLWVELHVFNPHIESIRTGDTVELHASSRPQEVTTGRISHVGDVIDPETRSATMRVEVDNRARRLRPGQAVVASIHASGPSRTTLLVPRTAVTLVDGRPTVFVEESPTRFVPTVLHTGGQDGRMVEVTDGLEEGDRVVTQGVFALKSELFR